MKNENLKEKYEEIYKVGRDSFFTFSAFPHSLEIIQQIDWENKEVLEIGCGEGKLAAMIQFARAKHILGIDYSKEAIDKANKNYNLEGLGFKQMNYNEEKETMPIFDIIIMDGILEHLNNPFIELKWIIKNLLKLKGQVLLACPSFLNPRGYIWMTLQILYDIQMSLTDLHFLNPFDFKDFCRKYKYTLTYKSVYQNWGSGDKFIQDFNKRLRKVLPNNIRIDELLRWLDRAIPYFEQTNDTGAIIVYKIQT